MQFLVRFIRYSVKSVSVSYKYQVFELNNAYLQYLIIFRIFKYFKVFMCDMPLHDVRSTWAFLGPLPVKPGEGGLSVYQFVRPSVHSVF